MTISGEGGLQVPGPQCRPSRSGLKTVADEIPHGDNTWAKGLEWDQLPCDTSLDAVQGQCPVVPEQRKTPAVRGFGVEESTAFAMYVGWECSAGAMDTDEAWANAEKLFNQGWWSSLERIFWTGLDQDGNPITQTLADAGAVDLTPAGGPLDITSGVAVLESYGGTCSDCELVIHGNKGLAAYFAERNLIYKDGEQTRFLGTDTLLAAGAGYQVSGPGGAAPATDAAWIYISGGVSVVHGPTFFTPPRGDVAGAVDMSINDITVFAERLVAFQRGCCHAAVQVELDSGFPIQGDESP